MTAGGMSIKYVSPMQFPESLDWDAKRGRFLVGSVAKSTVEAVYPDGRVEQVVADPDYKGCATLGISVDSALDRLIVTVHSNNPAAPYDGVAAYDLATNARIYLVDLGKLPADNPPRKDLPPFANDAVAGPDGAVYVTDTNRSLIWKVSKDGSHAAVWAAFPLFDAFPKTYQGAWDLGLNGIVVHPGGTFLLTSSVRSGRFFKVPLDGAPPDEVVFAKDNFPGIDGIRLRPDGRLVAVADDKAWLIASSDEWKTASLLETVPLEGANVATAVAIRDGVAYVSYAHFGEVFSGKLERSDFVLQRVDFKCDE